MKQLKLLMFMSLLSACGVDQKKSDADVELDEMIVGKWIYRENIEKSNIQCINLYCFDESGHFTYKAGLISEEELDDEAAYAGKASGEWELDDDELTIIHDVEYVFGERVEGADTIYKVKILSIDENKMVWKSDGKKKKLKRVE